MSLYERAGTSNLVRPPLVVGLSMFWGTTRCGASKLFTAFRSLPVRTDETSTLVGDLSCQLISTECAFDKSRLSTNTATFPVCWSIVPATSRYATSPIPATSYVGDSTRTLRIEPRANCSAQLYG